jgi:hypothetical protein
VDLVGELQVQLLGDGQEPAQQLGLRALDAHEREAELRRPAEQRLAELELLVGRHVAVAAAAHVEVRAERARVEPVAVERLAPGAHELVGHDGVRRQHLRRDDLDARPDAELGDPVEEAGEVVPSRPELGARRVQGQAELERVGIRRGRRRRDIRHQRRRRGIAVGHRQGQGLLHDVRHVHAGAAVGTRRDLHVRQPQFAEQLDLVRLAEGRRLRPGDDEQRVRLQVPEHVVLLGQLVERVAHAVELEREVLGIHRLAVDGEAQRRHRRQPEAAVPGQGERERQPIGVGPKAGVVDESVRHGSCPVWDGSGSDAAAQSSPSAIRRIRECCRRTCSIERQGIRSPSYSLER